MPEVPVTREYNNGEIKVFWRQPLCTHCQACITGLPEVFDLTTKPWVNMNGATTEQIIAQVEQCPSGALTFKRFTP